jgi:hypothetical protein
MFTELRIKFEVTRSVIGVPNLMKIQLFNLKESTALRITKEFQTIRLLAGYPGNTALIFSGQIRNILHLRENQTKIAEIYAGDGLAAYEKATAAKTFNKGVTVKEVVQDIAKSFGQYGVSNGKLDGLNSSRNKLRGLSYSGASKDILNNLGDDYDFDWSIQDGALTTVARDQSDNSTEAVLINRTTGMIGSPAITEIGADVTTSLNPKLIPNKRIKIESEAPQVNLSGNLYFRRVNRTLGNGIFKIQKVVHMGDSRGNDWKSMVTGLRLTGGTNV